MERKQNIVSSKNDDSKSQYEVQFEWFFDPLSGNLIDRRNEGKKAKKERREVSISVFVLLPLNYNMLAQ